MRLSFTEKFYCGNFPATVRGLFNRHRIATVAFLLPLFLPIKTMALMPSELLVVANRSFPGSVSLAEYYMKKRGIPAANLLILDASTCEQISRADFERQISSPVGNFLLEKNGKGMNFKCILLMYGIPLRIMSEESTLLEKGRSILLRERVGDLKARIGELKNIDARKAGELKKELAAAQSEFTALALSTDGASVDSEIALVREKGHPLNGWLPNRYFVGFRGKVIRGMPLNVILTCRLDGPSEKVVRRMIDDSLEAEEKGLSGKAYFDARWKEKAESKPSPYRLYDRAIHNTARLLRESGKLPVVLDERERLFQPGEAPDAALYCGWYSLGKYINAFTWARGAVGYHVASSECTTLKAESSTEWCRSMLENGAAATVGPVAEPYLQSFPQPEIFFGCITDGKYALAECYALANPFWSWQMVLIGDPLYRPFKKDIPSFFR